MIRINKGPAPAFMLDPAGPWQTETQKAIAYYANPSNTKAFDFEQYNKEKVKDALRAVFTKCAYCESQYDASSDGDIEHFRPKGRVHGKVPDSPGYYWLANDWDNLLLSCQHCNQGRKHILHGNVNRNNQKVGKLDQFPLRPPGTWVSDHLASLDQEEPHRLLLNPCIDVPDDHFDYDEVHALMIPKTDMAKTSIEVYALTRHLLVKRRQELLTSLLAQLEYLKIALEDYNANASEKYRKRVEMHWDTLKGFTKTNAPYAGMCRYFVRRFILKNNLQ